MSDKHLRQKSADTRSMLDQRRSNLEMWYYERPHGLLITVVGGRRGVIPWRQIKAALKRKEQR